MVFPVEGDRTLRPQPPHQLDLLLGAPAAVGELLAERLELDGVPAQSNTEPESPAGEQIDLGGLLGHQHRLSLRQDDDAGDEFQCGDRGQVAEHDEGLVKRGVDVIGALPTLMHCRVCAHDVVVGEDVGEP